MRPRVYWILVVALFPVWGAFVQAPPQIAARVVDPTRESITTYWKDAQGHIMGNIGTLKTKVEAEERELLFAMNGGMYMADHSPVGLYIEDGRILQRIDRRTEGRGNFYLQPNGVFGLRMDGSAFVKTTAAMQDMRHVRYATQSGPLLVSNGVINALFTPGSKNLNIRNGVGVRVDGTVVFAISTEPINFHDFATWFAEQGCSDALYLDGAVSKAYIPEAGVQGLDGELGVLIGISKAR